MNVELQSTSLADAQYVIKCVKTGNTVEVFYAFIQEREFWGQIDVAAKFDDLAQAITKMESIAAGEAGDDVFISLKEQLDEDVAALYVVRTTDNAIMSANSFWGTSAQVPESSRMSDAFLLKVTRENEDDVYINVTEDAEISVTANAEEAARYGDVNLVRMIIQQLQDATVGELSSSHDTPEQTEMGTDEQTDGWAVLKLQLMKRPADYTQGVPVDEDGAPINTLQLHEKVTLEIVDVNREETVETHLMRTVVMIASAHYYALRIHRPPHVLLWLNKEGGVDEDFDPTSVLVVSAEDGRRLIQALADLDVEQAEGADFVHLAPLKRRLIEGADQAWVEMVDIEAQIAVSSAWLKLPFHLEEVKL